MSFGNKNHDNLKTNPYAALAHNYAGPAANAAANERLAFIRRTYLHVAGAVAAFIAIEMVIFGLFGDQIMAKVLPMITGWSWLVVLGAFMGVSWLAQKWAHNETSQSTQYAGLSLYVVAQALIFVPLLAIAANFSPAGTILTAAILTLIVFGGLTAIVFVTKKDFSFLGPALTIGFLAAMGAIIVGTVMGLNIFGMFFAAAMVLLVSGSILYNTSNMLHHYRTDQHVGAALSLFADLAILFWYILRLVMMFAEE